MEEVIEQYGISLEESVSRWKEEGDEGWWEFVHEKSEVRIRLRHGTQGKELSFSQLTEIAKFAASSVAYVGEIVVDKAAMPWTSPSDKLSQLEFYYSRQSTAVGTHCTECAYDEMVEGMGKMSHENGEVEPEGGRGRPKKRGRGQNVIPLSKIGEGGKREVVWWCRECGRLQEISTRVTPREDTIMEQLEERQFDSDMGLGGDLTWESFRYYLDRLPSRKAPGIDGIPYELLRDAQRELQEMMFTALNRLLNGEAVPDE